MDPIDREIAALARRQHGIVTRQQLMALGLSQPQIGRRLRRGQWDIVGRGTFAVAGLPSSTDATVMAACMAVPGAVASWLTAAGLHGLVDHAPPVPHLTVPYGRSTASPTAVVHRARLSPVDTTHVGAIPTTSVARTLVDLAAVLGPRRLQGVVDQAMHAGTTAAMVDDAWERSQRAPGRRGHAKLLDALLDWRPAIQPGSPGEVRLIRHLRAWGLPEPERQIVVVDERGTVVGRLDLGWRDRRIGVEYDSDRWHDPTRWGDDERRHQALEALGWVVLHADKTDLRVGATGFRQALEAAWRHAA